MPDPILRNHTCCSEWEASNHSAHGNWEHCHNGGNLNCSSSQSRGPEDLCWCYSAFVHSAKWQFSFKLCYCLQDTLHLQTLVSLSDFSSSVHLLVYPVCALYLYVKSCVMNHSFSVSSSWGQKYNWGHKTITLLHMYNGNHSKGILINGLKIYTD